jgi:hypothetical protein
VSQPAKVPNEAGQAHTAAFIVADREGRIYDALDQLLEGQRGPPAGTGSQDRADLREVEADVGFGLGVARAGIVWSAR